MKRNRMEIRIEGLMTVIGVNNVIRMANRIPFTRIDAVYHYANSDTVLVYISTPFKFVRKLFTEKVITYGHKVIWV